jgi:CRP/FNR family transcriptional regulator
MKSTETRYSHGARTEVGCQHCDLLGFCNLAGLGRNEACLDQVVHRRVPVGLGNTLVVNGEPCDMLYAVKSGMFKAVVYTGAGEERVVDFYLPGELIGLDAMDCGGYRNTVIAVENSSVCVMDIQQLSRPPTLERFKDQLIAALVWKLRLDQARFRMLGAQSADQRLAMFLLDMAERLHQHGLPDEKFRLSMLRRDIASYLGLALETVGRTFKRFEQQGWIETRGRQTCLNQPEALATLSGLTTTTGFNPMKAASQLNYAQGFTPGP